MLWTNSSPVHLNSSAHSYELLSPKLSASYRLFFIVVVESANVAAFLTSALKTCFFGSEANSCPRIVCYWSSCDCDPAGISKQLGFSSCFHLVSLTHFLTW